MGRALKYGLLNLDRGSNMINIEDIKKELKELKKNTGLDLEIKNFKEDDIDDIFHKLEHINKAYKEKYDCDYLFKSILNGDVNEKILDQAKSFGVSLEYEYNVILIETKENVSKMVCQVIKQLFPVNLYNYAVPVKDNMAVFVHAVIKDRDTMTISEVAGVIADTLKMEAMIVAKVSYSEQNNDLYSLCDAYEKALTALVVGKMYYYQNDVYSYQKIGIGEMICGISEEVSTRFLNSIPKKDEIEKLDPELINAINCFFDNNLNIAETSRQFHMHRNTLVYRIEQIEKKTGFDIREFEDAVTLKIALMILKNRKTWGM